MKYAHDKALHQRTDNPCELFLLSENRKTVLDEYSSHSVLRFALYYDATFYKIEIDTGTIIAKKNCAC